MSVVPTFSADAQLVGGVSKQRYMTCLLSKRGAIGLFLKYQHLKSASHLIVRQLILTFYLIDQNYLTKRHETISDLGVMCCSHGAPGVMDSSSKHLKPCLSDKRLLLDQVVRARLNVI